ncbi:porin PorA family protein [Nocardioides sp. NPDC047086]|uniref:porin PorA family protein n=1 Tax=Nocardioides sp. NPDC047086 TaxID=3154810 RepID=UPI00340E69B2
MRRVIGYVFLLVGAFALVAAAVAGFWGRDAAATVPLNVDTTTVLDGTASGALAKSDTPVPVKYTRTTEAAPKDSTDDVVVFIEAGCIVIQEDNPPPCLDPEQDERAVLVTTRAYAMDRKTSEVVEDQAKYVGEEQAVPGMKGLAGKFPFDTQRHDYEYWDGTLGSTIVATYVDDVEIKGVKTYQYEVNATSDDAILSPGDDEETDTEDDVRGTYEATQTIYVEPTTGSYIDQSATQKMVTSSGLVLVDAEMSYSDKTVSKNAEDAKANIAQLNLIGTWIPVGGVVLGLIFLLIGLWLVLRGRKPNGGSHAAADDRTLVDA